MRLLIVCIFSLALVGCSSAVKHGKPHSTGEGVSVENLKIKHRTQSTLPSNYVVLVENIGSRWVPISLSLKGGYMERQNPRQEVLYISHDFKKAGPYYETIPASRSDFIECDYFDRGKDTGSLSKDLWTKKEHKGYSPCTSELVETNATLSAIRGLIALPTLGVFPFSTNETKYIV